jgi:hypothetical protein
MMRLWQFHPDLSFTEPMNQSEILNFLSRLMPVSYETCQTSKAILPQFGKAGPEAMINLHWKKRLLIPHPFLIVP